MSGCATGRSTFRHRLGPLDIIPEDFFLYFKINRSATNIPVINERLEEFSAEMGIPQSFMERTNNITAVFFDDDWGYIVAQGRYPDSFIRRSLRRTDGWEENSYQRIRYFISDNAKTIIISLKNTVIVSDFPMGQGRDFADQRAKRIIDIILSNETVSYPPVADSVFRITSNSPGSVFTQFVAQNVSLDNIIKVNFDIILEPRNRKTGGIHISFMVEEERHALLFNSVIRLFISDYVVKNRITDVRTLRENNSIFHSGVFVYVNILDMPLEKLNMFIADFIGEANWLQV
ncbi:MAG: hypothetical protein FWD87_09505 [Spirochaetaceae bacterium]|nr:hypothetical protein [Spirochaetaceae bacterium]